MRNKRGSFPTTSNIKHLLDPRYFVENVREGTAFIRLLGEALGVYELYPEIAVLD